MDEELSRVGWHTDADGRVWLVVDDERTSYYRIHTARADVQPWALYDDRERTRPWPFMGRFVIAFRTLDQLEDWIRRNDLP